MSSELVYLLLGGSLLLAAVLPQLLHRWALSAPIVLVATGMLIGLIPSLADVELDPVAARPVVEHVTEITVLVALMGVGLALDRPLRLRERASWRAWSPAWRLLGIAMPLTIGAVALLAWGPLGVAAPAAVLLGAALSPTDPVLASDVQVEGPTLEGDAEEIDEDDEVRFALTSEAGLNDGLAFPFVYAAIFLATVGPVSQWGLEWLVVGPRRQGGGRCRGGRGRRMGDGPARVPRARRARCGWRRWASPCWPSPRCCSPTARPSWSGATGSSRCSRAPSPCARSSATTTTTGTCTTSSNRLETLLTLVVLLGLGFALTNGLLTHLDWRGVLVALALVLVIRPVVGWLSFLGHRTQVGARASTTGSAWSSPSSGCAGSARSTTSPTPRGPRASPRSAGCGRRWASRWRCPWCCTASSRPR